jgi:hypothetical protein
VKTERAEQSECTTRTERKPKNVERAKWVERAIAQESAILAERATWIEVCQVEMSDNQSEEACQEN